MTEFARDRSRWNDKENVPPQRARANALDALDASARRERACRANEREALRDITHVIARTVRRGAE